MPLGRSIAVLALVAAVGAGIYFYPEIGRALGRQDQAATTSDSGNASGSGRGQNGGRGGGGPIPVKTAQASVSNFPIRRYATGFLSSPAVVSVNARITSQVTQIAVADGQVVKAGDLLFQLDDRALRAQLAKDQATLAKDQASQASAQADLARAKDLLGKGAGTQQAYDQQLATTNGFNASIAADQAAIDADNVQLGFARIVAPISGRLGAVNVTVGDLVGGSSGSSSSSTSNLVTITQMDPLEVNFSLPESDLALLQKELANPAPSAVTLTRAGQDEPMATGKLDFVDSTVDTASGTINARAAVANPDGKLWPGQYADLTIAFGALSDAVSVPTVAVQTGQQGSFVYVVGDDGKVAMRPVTIAMADGGNSAVSDGLKQGERVVIEGQGKLRDGAQVREGNAVAENDSARTPAPTPAAAQNGSAGQ